LPGKRALLAGASGLVGRALLGLLLESPRYRRVQVLLRRPVAGLPGHDKLDVSLVDFAALPPLRPVDEVFVALGTTIRAAGSQQAFRRVDFDAVLAVARAGRAAGARCLLVVSALGADAGSKVFYNRVKGDMERAVAELGYERVVIARPSLIVGDRRAIGQPPRLGEEWAQRLLRPVVGLVPRAVRPISADAIARALLRAAQQDGPGVILLTSASMQ
jgi:uncharacterized protein YbjT (DUF2867 family)